MGLIFFKKTKQKTHILKRLKIVTRDVRSVLIHTRFHLNAHLCYPPKLTDKPLLAPKEK